MPPCAKCNYDLSGITAVTCPECGWTVGKPFERNGTRWPTVLFAVLTIAMSYGIVGAGHGAGWLWMFWFPPSLYSIPPVLSVVTAIAVSLSPLRGVRAVLGVLTSLAWLMLVLGLLEVMRATEWPTFLLTAAVGLIAVASLALLSVIDLYRARHLLRSTSV